MVVIFKEPNLVTTVIITMSPSHIPITFLFKKQKLLESLWWRHHSSAGWTWIGATLLDRDWRGVCLYSHLLLSI